jgi:hypothetical protein
MGHQADPAHSKKFSFPTQIAVHLTKHIYIVFVTGEDDIADTTTGDTNSPQLPHPAAGWSEEISHFCERVPSIAALYAQVQNK